LKSLDCRNYISWLVSAPTSRNYFSHVWNYPEQRTPPGEPPPQPDKIMQTVAGARTPKNEARIYASPASISKPIKSGPEFAGRFSLELGRFAHKNRKKSQKIEEDFGSVMLIIKELVAFFGFQSV
jgi:hypothetical protein